MVRDPELSKHLETNGTKNIPLLEFSHAGREFRVLLEHVKFQSADGSGYLVSIVVKSGEHLEAFISGTIRINKQSGSNEFFSAMLGNVEIQEKSWDKRIKTNNHVSDLVGQTIRQLLLYSIFDRWTSSASISDGAVVMYERLRSDKDLVVTKNYHKKPKWFTAFRSAEDVRFSFTVEKREKYA